MKPVIALIALLTLFLVASCSKPCPTCNGTGKSVSLGALHRLPYLRRHRQGQEL